MLTETIRTAARIVDPKLADEPFDGTFDEALAAMVTYAADMRNEYGPDAGRTRLARALVNSQADRVAEVAAAALLRLTDMDPKPTLTRADKERAVREMSWRLMSATCEYDRHCSTPGAEDYARTLRRRHAALVRLAMARTVD